MGMKSKSVKRMSDKSEASSGMGKELMGNGMPKAPKKAPAAATGSTGGKKFLESGYK